MTSAILALGQAVPFTTRTAADFEAQVLAKLADWRTTLRTETPEARQVIRQIVVDRIAFEATEEAGARAYRYRGTYTLGGLFEGIVGPQAVASPTGTVPGLPNSFSRRLALGPPRCLNLAANTAPPASAPATVSTCSDLAICDDPTPALQGHPIGFS